MGEMEIEEVNLREMHCELNFLSRPDGSAILSQGDSVVLVGIYGPVECKIQYSDIHKASLEVYFSTKAGQPTVRERLRETNIKQTCESALHLTFYPRDAISVNIQVLEDAGGLMATSINACCLALLNSGLAMKFLFAAVNCAIKSSGEIILDPSVKDLDDTVAQITFVFDSVDKNIISSSTEGSYSAAKYHDCLERCRVASEKVFAYYRDIVEKYSPAL